MPLPTTPALATDCVIIDADRRILLVRRKNAPFQGQFALPGGFVEIGESVEDACRRELLEETGLRVLELTLVGVYSGPSRDPRGHIVSIAFLAIVDTPEARAGDDAAETVWAKDVTSLELAFDHRQIISDALWVLGSDDVTSLS